jgi:hypothetical protein
VGAAPAVAPTASTVAVPAPATDPASWKALSRPAKSKSAAHRRGRPRAAAESSGDDDKEKAATAESQKADPFAD